MAAHELASNAACLLLHHAPAAAPFARLLRRGDAGRVPQEYVVRVASREPITLLCGLDMGPQHPPPTPSAHGADGRAGAAAHLAAADRRVAVICGPTGAGRATLARRLLAYFPDKLAAAPRLTARRPHPQEGGAGGGEPASSNQAAAIAAAAGDSAPAPPPGGAPPIGSAAPGSEFLRFVSERDLAILHQAGGLAQRGRHLGAACGTPTWGLEAAWARGRVALVVGPLAVAEELKRLPGVEVRLNDLLLGLGGRT